MWKNIFIETCVLSALIFGGFYINASILKKEIFDTHEDLLLEQKARSDFNRLHFSGNLFSTRTSGVTGNHVSGDAFGAGAPSSLSGAKVPPVPSSQLPGISGNRA